MVNLIGGVPPLDELLELRRDAHVHLYGKEPRAGRKVGHVTLVGCARGRGCGDRSRSPSAVELDSPVVAGGLRVAAAGVRVRAKYVVAPCAGPRRGCSARSSRGPRVRASPGRCADQRLPRADASRTSAAGGAGGRDPARARPFGEAPKDQKGARPGERPAAGVEEEVGSMPAIEVRAAECEVAAHRFDRRPPERHDPLLAALAEHADDAARRGRSTCGRGRPSRRPADRRRRGARRAPGRASRRGVMPVGGVDQPLGLGG